MRRLLLLILLFAFSQPLWSQKILERSELGLTLGGMNYLGDLNNQSMLGTVATPTTSSSATSASALP